MLHNFPLNSFIIRSISLPNFRKLGNSEHAKINAYFFKTGKGEYGEGDRFLGITVPQTRLFAKQHCSDLSHKEIEEILSSPWHEERLLALIILVNTYKKSDESTRTKIYKLYLKHIGKGINNWDLVDTSAAYIIGMHLENKNRDGLYTLAASKNLWKKRVAIVATFFFIRQDDFADTLRLCELFLSEKHDLVHKACGWMLREVGKRDVKTLRAFLKKHSQNMPRTMLRYAIERLSAQEKTLWMKKK